MVPTGVAMAEPGRRVYVMVGDGSWLMLRGSGTEPILRIYAEAKSDADAQKLLQLGVSLTKRV